ncbi:MAG: hypothetical protein OXE99_14550 [Cellvibrionales bacterium]|nr:hypothetical protein [Cellvibrionales bacterium]
MTQAKISKKIVIPAVVSLAALATGAIAVGGTYYYFNETDARQPDDAGLQSGSAGVPANKVPEKHSAKTVDLIKTINLLDGVVETDTILNLPITDNRKAIEKAIENNKQIYFRGSIYPAEKWIDPQTGKEHAWQLTKQYCCKPWMRRVYPTEYMINHYIEGKFDSASSVVHVVGKKKVENAWNTIVPAEAKANVKLPDLNAAKGKGYPI